MAVWLLKRLIQAPLVLFLLITVSFFFIRAAPGGPFSHERKLDPRVEEVLRRRYHMDEPLGRQYLRYLGAVIRGDLGPSFRHHARGVNEIIAAALPPSLLLGALALALALLAGTTAGIICAVRHNRAADHGVMLLALVGLGLPTFVIGPLLQVAFAVHARLLPLAGYAGPARPAYLILPALTLAVPFAARIARLMRAGMLDVLGQDFIRTARAKGLSGRAVVLHHALRGAILPVVSYLGPATAQIMTGSLVVERIFQIPGLGREFVEGALNRDYTLVMGMVIVYGAFLIACNLLTDILHALLDPRVGAP